MWANLRLVKPIVGAAKPIPTSNPLLFVPARTMAGGQKQLKQRIVAVGNVKKITKAMQMIASSKMKPAERRMQLGRVFARDMLTIWPKPKADLPPVTIPAFIPFTSDRGLCGSLNSGVTRVVKRFVDPMVKANQNFTIVIIGEKGRAHLERAYSKWLSYVITDAGKIKPVTFSETSLIADMILRANFDEATLFYNRFVNQLSYAMTQFPLPSKERALADRDAWLEYDFEGVDEELLENLYEFRVGALVYYFLGENGCAEMSSRVNSMSNSSKNAAELVDKLLLLYNRTRQGQVTTELLEVISGAMSVDEQQKGRSEALLFLLAFAASTKSQRRK